MADCIFCKIINGDIPSYKLYEDDTILAFLDAFPGTKGHTLIIPKQHFENMYDTPPDTWCQMIKVAHFLGIKLQKALNCDGMNIMQNNGKAAGQSVFHIHLHLFPRWTGDNAMGLWNPGSCKDDLKATQEIILNVK